MQTNFIIFIIAGVWLVVISFFLGWIFYYFKRLSKDVEKGNLIDVIDKIIKKEKQNSKDITKNRNEIKEIISDSKFHVQKIGFVRFNPFEELGGDHSFSLAVLDANMDGFILTGLHTRERTRVYVKEVSKGKTKLELSKEERKALKQASK